MTTKEAMVRRYELFIRLLVVQNREEFARIYTYLIGRNQGSKIRLDSSTVKRVFAPETEAEKKEAAEPRQRRTWKSKHKPERLEWLRENPKAKFKEYEERWGMSKKVFYHDKMELGQRKIKYRRTTKKCQKKKLNT